MTPMTGLLVHRLLFIFKRCYPQIYLFGYCL
nr:MAG TPA: hypothetical protein [Caudoviricetes sp.]